MKSRSLALRLSLISLLLLPLFLGATAYALQYAFRVQIEATQQQQLRTWMYSLLAVAELQQGDLILPEVLTEPRFNQPGSGLYALVRDPQGVVWRSDSSLILDLAVLPVQAEGVSGEEYFGQLSLGQHLLDSYRYNIVWEDEQGQEWPYQIILLQDHSEISARLGAFRDTLLYWLAFATVGLVVTLWLLLYWGLRPLKRLADDVLKIERGEAPVLSGDYPAEIQPVTDNLNHLLDHERQQRERYRNTMADLAHSLKTPLTVIQGAVKEDTAQAEVITDQVKRMTDIVNHQLQRAAGKQHKLQEQQVSVLSCVMRLCDVLEKVYQSPPVAIDYEASLQCLFCGDERDMMEILGNLMDNACKYGRGEVRVEANRRGDQLHIDVADNGDGIAVDLWQSALARGQRLDSQTPGQGIGLSVVVDILESYGGRLEQLPQADWHTIRIILPTSAAP